MTNLNRVKSVAVDMEYRVIVIATGEVLATFDSVYLAKRMVCTINGQLDKPTWRL